MRFLLTILFVSLSLLFVRCQKDPGPCLKSTGEIIKKQYDFSAVHTIEIYDDIHVNFVQDSNNYIEIEAGEKLHTYLKPKIDAESIVLRNENKCNWLRSLKNQITAEIHITNLDSIYYRGTGNINSIGRLNLNRLNLMALNSSGSVKLQVAADSISLHFQTGVVDASITGQAEYTYIFASGDAPMDLAELNSGIIHVNNSCRNTIEVSSREKLIAENWSLGNTIYSGSPNTIIKRGDGKGQLLKKN